VAGDAQHAAAHPAVTLTRLLAAGALLLMIAITTTSAYIRLTLAGLGCTDWPECYRAAQAAGAAAADVTVARGLHRLVASLTGVWLLALLAFGWSDLPRWRPRLAIAGLVTLAVLLAWLGSYTPSTLPAVTLGNLLGGMVMVGLAAYLCGWCTAAGRPCPPPASRAGSGAAPVAAAAPVHLALALLLLQVGLGALLGAHGAAAECARLPACGAGWLSAETAWRVFWPFAGDLASASSAARIAGLEALHTAHRGLGAVVSAGVAWAAVTLLVRGTGPGRTGAALAAAALAGAVLAPALGAMMVLHQYPLAAALMHNLMAALLAAALAAAAGRLAALADAVAAVPPAKAPLGAWTRRRARG
jgi:heme a synthase